MITSLMFSLCLIFAGVFQPLAQLISFWHWMYTSFELSDGRYYVSPLQWMIGATVSNALHDVSVTCTTDELSIIQPPSGNSVSFCSYSRTILSSLAGPILGQPTEFRTTSQSQCHKQLSILPVRRGRCLSRNLEHVLVPTMAKFRHLLRVYLISVILIAGISSSISLPSSFSSTLHESQNSTSRRLRSVAKTAEPRLRRWHFKLARLWKIPLCVRMMVQMVREVWIIL